MAADTTALVWVGRMEPVKGLDVLLRAFARVRATAPAVQLHLVGDGSLRPKLEALAAELQVRDGVHFAGSVAPESLGHWYRAANLTVLSSHSEGLPNVLRESAACGTPFVSTDVGGVSEIADPDHDRLVPKADPAAFAAAVLDQLNRPAPTRPRDPLPDWDAAALDFADRLTRSACETHS